MNEKLIAQKLRKKKQQLDLYAQRFLGYPCNANIKGYKPLFDLMSVPFNNVGDPFVDSSYKLTTKSFEKEVLRFLAKLYKLPRKDFWGYVTSGGTEGNMYGLFVGRELHPKGLLYFSVDSHYSILKAARLLRMESVIVSSTPDGAIDLVHLEKMLRKNRKRDPIISLNIGTTMKGAIDDLDGVVRLLKKLKIKKYYIHCDAALFGMLVPFLKGAPVVNFKKPIGSIAISGHKFIGSPVPCGVVLTKKKFTKSISQKVEYVDTIDNTITGSRSALGPLVIWYAIKTRKYEGFRKEANECVENAKYLKDKLERIKYPVFLNNFSNTVVLKKPSKKLVRKWTLASEGEWSHVVVMQHVTKSKLERFFKDVKKEALGKRSKAWSLKIN